MKKLSVNSFKPKYDLDIRSEVAYSVNSLLKHGYDIDYDVKLQNGKNLQRDLVWSLEQKQELIRSIMKSINIPSFVMVMFTDDIKESANYGKKIMKVIDGKQRLSTILSFVDNKFPLNVDGIDYFFNDFDEDAKQHITHSHSLKFKIVYEYPDALISDENLVYLFEMINFAGTPQDKEHMNMLLATIK